MDGLAAPFQKDSYLLIFMMFVITYCRAHAKYLYEPMNIVDRDLDSYHVGSYAKLERSAYSENCYLFSYLNYYETGNWLKLVGDRRPATLIGSAAVLITCRSGQDLKIDGMVITGKT